MGGQGDGGMGGLGDGGGRGMGGPHLLLTGLTAVREFWHKMAVGLWGEEEVVGAAGVTGPGEPAVSVPGAGGSWSSW